MSADARRCDLCDGTPADGISTFRLVDRCDLCAADPALWPVRAALVTSRRMALCDRLRYGDRRVAVAASTFGEPGAPRWVASLHVNDEQWSWECPHLHHSPEAAARCVRGLTADVEAAFAPDAEATVLPVGFSSDLVELEYRHPGDSWGRRSRRLGPIK